MRKILYLECKTGAAGDMLMGALYGLLSEEQKEKFLAVMNHIADRVTVTPQEVCKQGIGGIHMCVEIDGTEEGREHGHVHNPAEAEGHEHSHETGECHAHTHEHSHEAGECHTHTHEHAHETGECHAHTHEHVHKAGECHAHTHEHSHETGECHAHTHEHVHEAAEAHTHTNVDHTHTRHHAHTGVSEILEKISRLEVSDRVKASAEGIYREIAAAESRVHRTSMEQIHFHEVGSVDALIDVVGSSLVIEMLGVDEILCSPVCVGNGTVRCAHGVLPVPAPATAEIIKGMPVYSSEFDGELLTPTGAAILKCFVQKFTPQMQMQIEEIGYGFGTKEFAQLSCVRAFLGWG